MERDDTKFYGMKWVLWYKKDAKTIKDPVPVVQQVN
jgi:hypothetical protein